MLQKGAIIREKYVHRSLRQKNEIIVPEEMNMLYFVFDSIKNTMDQIALAVDRNNAASFTSDLVEIL